MDYNKKFQSILKDAEENGYIFENGKFIKNSKGFIPVMEVFLQTHTTYESSGYYNIYKHTFEISESDFKKVMSYIELMNDKTIDFGEEFDDDIYDEILLKYLNEDQTCSLFESGYFDGNVFFRNDEYFKYNMESKCGDIYFQYKDGNTESEFPVGWVSFYEMMEKDFEKAEDVNLNLTKFMRDN